MTAGSSSQTCQSCQENVVFITEAFGCICPHCGTVIEEVNFAWDSDVFNSKDVSSTTTSYKKYASDSRISQAAKRHLGSLNLNNFSQSKPDQDAIISGILTHFLYGSLQREVQDLIVQVNTLSARCLEQFKAFSIVKHESRLDDLDDDDEGKEENIVSNQEYPTVRSKIPLKGEQGMARLAVAATFSVLKKHDKGLTLKEVWNVVAIGKLDQIAQTLQYIESLLEGTTLSNVSREDPHVFIADQIIFLVEQSNLQVRDGSISPIKLQDNESILGLDEQNFIREANIEIAPFRQLALSLCQLCSYNGLHNRSAKINGRKDLLICAWAIVMIAMESSCGRICNEGKMAKAVVCFKTWLQSRLCTRISPEELSDLPSRSAMEELVKKRYVEISRMISTYLEYLPWLKDEAPVAKEKQPYKKSKSKAIPRVKEGLTSISPFSRKVVAKYLADVIKLRPYIENKMAAQIDSKTKLPLLWSRFGSTEEVFHSVRRSKDGQRRIKEEQENELRKDKLEKSNVAIGSLKQSQVMVAVEAILNTEEEKSNSLANTIGSRLLQLESLRDMSNEIVDSLLFLDGEMESYLRSPDQVKLIKTLRQDSGDWDTKTTSSDSTKISTAADSIKGKRARTEEDDGVAHIVNGKRTKAMTEAEAARILSEL